MLTSDVRDVAQRSVLCWLATVDQTGQPQVSPKEIFAVIDDHHVAIAHIASPRSVRNVEADARVCVSFVDVFVQKGFKIIGRARNVRKSDADFAHWSAPLAVMAGPRFPIHSVLVIQATAIEAILAPSYRLYPQDTTEAAQIASAMSAYGVRTLDDPASPGA